MPMVITVITAPCIKTLLMLIGDRKRSDRIVAITHNTISATSGIWFHSQSVTGRRLGAAGECGALIRRAPS